MVAGFSGTSAIARASRIVSILFGIAVTILLWPVAIPLGFDEVWWASQTAQSRPEPPPPPKPERPQPAIAPAPPQAETPPPQPQSLPAQQPVAPTADAVVPAQPPQADAKGERAAALNEPDKAAAPAPQTVTKLYYRVAVRDGGTLQADGVTIRLAGIAARNADATCKGKAGKAWPCGAAAKTALTRLIRSRAVSCELPKAGAPDQVVARCSVAGGDLSTWMVRHGWAEPSDANEPALAEAAQSAKKDKLGLWQ